MVAAGKENWTRPRSDQVEAKGKGVLKTYWLDPKGKSPGSTTGSSDSGYSDNASPSIKPADLLMVDKKKMVKQERLVTWIVDMLDGYIQKLVTLRKTEGNSLFKATSVTFKTTKDHTPLDEVAEVIYLPRFDKKDFEEVTLGKRQQAGVSDEVLQDLKEFVSAIASSYLDNPFHNVSSFSQATILWELGKFHIIEGSNHCHVPSPCSGSTHVTSPNPPISSLLGSFRKTWAMMRVIKTLVKWHLSSTTIRLASIVIH